MKAAAILTGAESGVPCPTNEALGRPSKAVAEAAPTAAATVRKLAAALSWRAPLVLIPYLWYVVSVYRNCVDRVNPFAESSLLAPAIGTPLYLIAVFGGKWLMKDREAFEPTEWMIVYNLYQTVLNMYCVYAFIWEVWNLGVPMWGMTLDLETPRMSGIGFVIWLHYNNKFIEFFDTIFMVLRKKNKQISFLHVYHHFLLVWAWFFVCKFACGGDAYFGAIMNSFIHVVMYGYYFLSLMKIPCPWKKYVTVLQLAQFVICATHASYAIYLGDTIYPRSLAALDIFVMTNMFVLFMNFYRKSYSKKGADKKKSVKDAEPEGKTANVNGHGKAGSKKDN